MKHKNELKPADFQKVELYVGTVETAEVFKEARNPSYKLVIDFGPLGKRKSSAQITKKYTPESIVGQQIVAILNFAPKQIANMMSECLVLGAVEANDLVTLLMPESNVPNGTRIS